MFEMKEKLKHIANYYGIESQARQTMEECAELIQALNKYIRIKEGYTTKEAERAAICAICEEIADVAIMLEQMKMYFDIEKEVCEKVKEKIDRVIGRIDAERQGNK